MEQLRPRVFARAAGWVLCAAFIARTLLTFLGKGQNGLAARRKDAEVSTIRGQNFISSQFPSLRAQPQAFWCENPSGDGALRGRVRRAGPTVILGLTAASSCHINSF